jgi:hypothetical protein
MEVTIRKLIFSLLLLVIMLMVSCGNSGSSKIKAENEISFDTISINKRQHLDNDSTRPFCDISVNFVYPVKSAKTNLDTLQRFFVSNMFGPSFEDLKPLAAVEAYISNYIDNYSHDAYTYSESVSDMEELNALIPGIDVDDSEHEIDKLFYSYYESLSDSITFNQHGILSFQIKQSNSKGESASYYVSYSNHVINLNTGDQITEYDIFNAGVDMMICNTLSGFKIQPCVEINMRMNMGVVSRLFHNQFMNEDGEGEYIVDYFKKPESACKFHERLQQESPLKIKNGKIVSGYLSLTPVTADTHYVAYVIVK